MYIQNEIDKCAIINIDIQKFSIIYIYDLEIFKCHNYALTK